MSNELQQYCDAIQIRRQTAIERSASLLQINPRTELVDPYFDNQGNLLYTPEQLAMRRKLEILKYNRNPLTRKELLILQSQNRRYSQQLLQDISNGIATCESDNLIPTPSGNMNVPGTLIFTYQPSVPLYMFK